MKVSNKTCPKMCFTVMAIALLLTLSACETAPNSVSNSSEALSSSIPTDVSSTNESPSEESFLTPEQDTGDEDEQTSKILIAYFAVSENSEVDAIASASVLANNGEAKGFVRVLADTIQENVGADFFSIRISVAYPADIGTLIDFAAEEQERKARPELTPRIENLDEYDTIFIGYSKWYDLPMVMYSFFDAYDFTGKTIVPFCMHNGSGFCSTIQTIQELEPGAKVMTDGFTVNFAQAVDAGEDIAKWLGEIGC